MKFFCITDPESGSGFKLCGVKTAEVIDRNSALSALNLALSDKDNGIIIITKKANSFINEETSKIIISKKYPLIIEVPSRGEKVAVKSMNEFLKDAVGISV